MTSQDLDERIDEILGNYCLAHAEEPDIGIAKGNLRALIHDIVMAIMPEYDDTPDEDLPNEANLLKLGRNLCLDELTTNLQKLGLKENE